MSTPYHRAAVHLRHADSVVVCAHVSPDGDAIGSVLALTLALRDASIPAIPTLADDATGPCTYEFLPGFGLLTPANDLNVPAAFVALDTPNFERLGLAEDLARKAENLIVIDHHPDNAEFGGVNIVDSRAASTSQLIWRLIERLEVPVTPEIALCCYVGLMTDTGRFQYENTSPGALRDAAAMIEAGADPSLAARLVYQERSPAALDLDSRVLSRLTVANGGRVAYSWVTDADFEATGAHAEESENLVDLIRVAKGVDVAFLIREQSDGLRANLRSKTGYDVGTLAREMGGGGHAAAAGFTASGTRKALIGQLLGRLPGSGERP
ncbi:MAG: DHH family phosphoesterase [Actinomycetota bacterium]|nr:DHH family phosphoesterase [Actinomycetota bacterium]